MTHPPHIFGLYGAVPVPIQTLLACALVVLVLSLLGYVHVRDSERVEMLSWYWHFVDAVWIAVFTVVYVVGR